MTPRSLLLISAAAIAGWGTGAVVRSRPPENRHAERATSPEGPERPIARKPPLEATVPPPSAAPPRSTDTLETLKPLRGGELHARLALWLIDASPEDIAAFWTHYQATMTEGELSPPVALMMVDGMGTGWHEITELVFYHWMRRDPSAAMAAAKGDRAEFLAWQAWTAQDPRSAIDAATGEGKHVMEDVARALGVYQPSWLRQHLEELPESVRRMAVDAMIGNESDDAAANLRFLAKQGYGLRPESFTAAIRDDPWAAYDWIEYLEKSGNVRQAREQRDEFIRLAGEEHPEVIDALARTTPEGALKREMEDALFRNRLATDPQGAIEEAMETRAPAVAVNRLAEAGRMLVPSDPERAFELAKRMFDSCPDAFDTSIRIDDPYGSTSYGGAPNGGPEFAKALMAIDAARVLDLAVAGKDNGTSSSTFSHLTRMWSATDPEGLSAWAEAQPDDIHDAALQALIVHHMGQAENALNAAVRIRGSNRSSDVEDLLSRWHATDPVAAADWLPNSGLPPAEIEAFKAKFPREPAP
jgi:hypothetical protein